MRNIFIQSILIKIFLFSVIGSYGQTYYVDAARPDNTGAGTSWATAKKDFQEAINIAASGSQIWVKKGTYKPTKDVTGSTTPTDPRDKTFLLKTGVAVYGGFAGNETLLSSRNINGNVTTLSGDFIGNDVVSGSGSTLSITNNGENAYHVLVSTINTNTTVLDGFTIVGGNANGSGTVPVGIYPISRIYGGGLNIVNSDINIANCTFSKNAALYAGGLQIFDNSQNTFSNCIIQLNISGNNSGGMGIVNITAGKKTTITNSKFTGNKAGSYGGGIYILNSEATISTSFFSANYGSNGGAVFSQNGSTQGPGIRYSVFYNNISSSGGGAIYQTSGNISVESSLFYANQSALGGAIYFSTSSFLSDCTFSGNLATQRGAAIYFQTSGNIFNSIFWDGANSTAREIWAQSASNKPQIDNSIIQDATGSPVTIPNVNMGSGNLNGNPLFVNEAGPAGPDNVWGTGDDGLRLLSCSPAINSGFMGQWVIGTDITGAQRVQLGTVDMGAYEASSNTPGNTATPTNATMSITKIQGTYTDYVSDCLHNICRVMQNGSNPIRNTVTAKVWIENTQSAQFVNRHYEITPADQPSNYGGTITLYFTQLEFDAFNAVNAVKLPTGPADATGISNLLIEKRGGASSDGSGSPNTYPGAITNINPVDANIVWNAPGNRWEVTFDVAGFSGFFVKTISTALPVVFGEVTATIVNGQLLVMWNTVTETDVSKYIIEVSGDGNTFKQVGEVLTQATNGQSTQKLQYEFSKATSSIMGLMGLSLTVLLLLPFGMGRRKILLNVIAIMAVFTLAVASCSKKDATTSTTNENKALYVRIVQVDNVGNQQMSKVINATVK